MACMSRDFGIFMPKHCGLVSVGQKTTISNEREKKICLCHGMTGNLLIMKKYLEKNPDDDLRQKYERQFSNLKEQLQDMRSLMVTETLNPAFMNGITGYPGLSDGRKS